jgi:hypothetical protein
VSIFHQIHAHTWQDAWFFKLKALWKLLFIYLFSNRQADLSGLYELPLEMILFETGLGEEEVRKALAHFQASGRVWYDAERGHLFVRNLLRYHVKDTLAPWFLSRLRRYRESRGAGLRFWAQWEQAYPQTAERAWGPQPTGSGKVEVEVDLDLDPEIEKKIGQTDRKIDPQAASGGLEEAVRMLELARADGANELDRRRLAGLIEAAETHRLSLPRGAAGADRPGWEWVCEVIQVANAARRPGVPLSLNFVESVLQRWKRDGFQAGWGTEEEGRFPEAEFWGA